MLQCNSQAEKKRERERKERDEAEGNVIYYNFAAKIKLLHRDLPRESECSSEGSLGGCNFFLFNGNRAAGRFPVVGGVIAKYRIDHLPVEPLICGR